MNLMAAASQRGQSMPAEETTGAGHEYYRHGSASTRAIDVSSGRHIWLEVLSTGHSVLVSIRQAWAMVAMSPNATPTNGDSIVALGGQCPLSRAAFDPEVGGSQSRVLRRSTFSKPVSFGGVDRHGRLPRA
jgi:hypothetical protein